MLYEADRLVDMWLLWLLSETADPPPTVHISKHISTNGHMLTSGRQHISTYVNTYLNKWFKKQFNLYFSNYLNKHFSKGAAGLPRLADRGRLDLRGGRVRGKLLATFRWNSVWTCEVRECGVNVWQNAGEIPATLRWNSCEIPEERAKTAGNPHQTITQPSHAPHTSRNYILNTGNLCLGSSTSSKRLFVSPLFEKSINLRLRGGRVRGVALLRRVRRPELL